MPNWLEIVLLAVASMFWPTLITIVVLALRVPQPVRILAWFLLGGLLTTITIGLHARLHAAGLELRVGIEPFGESCPQHRRRACSRSRSALYLSRRKRHSRQPGPAPTEAEEVRAHAACRRTWRPGRIHRRSRPQHRPRSVPLRRAQGHRAARCQRRRQGGVGHRLLRDHVRLRRGSDRGVSLRARAHDRQGEPVQRLAAPKQHARRRLGPRRVGIYLTVRGVVQAVS